MQLIVVSCHCSSGGAIYNTVNSFCRLTDIDPVLLGEVVGFLKLFFDASQELEAERCVTLHLAVPWFHKLLAHCAPTTGDRSAASTFITEAARCRLSYCKVPSVDRTLPSDNLESENEKS
jgi:hypothetical protein